MTASPWRRIGAKKVQPGDTVSVTGITNARSVIMHVELIDVTPGRIVMSGFQPYGNGRRVVTRTVHPEAVVELYVAPNVASDE